MHKETLFSLETVKELMSLENLALSFHMKKVCQTTKPKWMKTEIIGGKGRRDNFAVWTLNAISFFRLWS